MRDGYNSREKRPEIALDHAAQVDLLAWTETYSGSAENCAESGPKASLSVPLRHFHTLLRYHGYIPVELVPYSIQSFLQIHLVHILITNFRKLVSELPGDPLANIVCFDFLLCARHAEADATTEPDDDA